MKKAILILIIVFLMASPVQAQSLGPPVAPEDALELMPQEQKTFSEDLWYVIRSAMEKIRPDIAAGCKLCLSVVAIAVLTSVLHSLPGKTGAVVELIGSIGVGTMIIGSTGTMIHEAAQTIQTLSDYAKLLLPVLTTAMAAQGGITASAALYTGTAVFDALLSALISSVMIPIVYIYIAISLGKSALGEPMLDKLQKFAKWLITWTLKTVMYVFTGYMTITGVVSGATDQSALKAMKLTISGMVPVVGGIMSDASEAILVSAGVVKNSVGIYGMIAMIAIAIGPFLRIGAQYILLKITASVCGILGGKRITGFMEDLSSAMGCLLAMTGTVCLMLLISVICFMKGVG